MNFDAALPEPSRIERLVAVEPDDLSALREQRLRRCRTRAREAHDESPSAAQLEPAHLRDG